MKIVIVTLIVLAAIILVIVAVGAALPQNHTATRERTFPAAPARLYDAISRVADYPKWKTGVRAVEELPPEHGHARFREVGSESITYEITEASAPTRFVTRIADKLPYGGSWVYEISPAAQGSKLRLTEQGEVYNPIFRFVSRFILGYYKTMDTFLDDLQKYLTR